MKSALLASVAVVAICAVTQAGAADMPLKAPPLAPVVPFTWTGCYIGAHFGDGWGRKEWSPAEDFFFLGKNATTVGENISGIFGGGQLGCNYQFAGNWVIGIEADGSGSDIHGSRRDPFSNKSLDAKIDWIASVTGRLGYSWDHVLLYGKGGAAWVGDEFHSTDGGNFLYDSSQTRSGWTAGAGLEWAFAAHWSALIEYDYYDFGTKTVVFSCTPPTPGGSGCSAPFGADIKQTLQTVRIGVNYRFW
jgi:outer membrane immunogenic protein